MDYSIVVPQDSQLHSVAGSGDVEVDGIQGPANFTCGSGDVTASNINRDVQIVCGSGDVELSKIKGQVQITTGSGDMTLNISAGRFVSRRVPARSRFQTQRTLWRPAPEAAMSLSREHQRTFACALHREMLTSKEIREQRITGIFTPSLPKLCSTCHQMPVFASTRDQSLATSMPAFLL